MATHASRNTTTGEKFEKDTVIGRNEVDVIDVSKTKFVKYLKLKGINAEDIWSQKYIPDEAYIIGGKRLVVYEKKVQHCDGTADEKPRGGCFLKHEYEIAAKALGLEQVEFIFVCRKK